MEKPCRSQADLDNLSASIRDLSKEAEVSQDKIAVSKKEFGQMFNLGRTKVNDMLKRGQVRSLKLGRLVRIPLSEVHAFVERQLAAKASDQAER
jgi:excisionase family DNA binding protein